MNVALKLAHKIVRELDLRDLKGRVAANDNFEFDALDCAEGALALGEAAPAALFLFPMWAAASAYLKDPQYYLNKRPATCGGTQSEEKRRPLEWAPLKRFAPSYHDYRNPQLSDADRQKLLEWVSVSKYRGGLITPGGMPQGLPHDPRRDDSQGAPTDFRNGVMDVPRPDSLPAIEHALPDLQQDDISRRLLMGDEIPGRNHSIGDFSDITVADKTARDFLSPEQNAVPRDIQSSWLPDVRMQHGFSPLNSDQVLEHFSKMQSDEIISASLLLHAQKCVMDIIMGWESGSEPLSPAHELTLPYLKMPWLPIDTRAMLLEMIAVTAWQNPGLDQTMVKFLKDGGRVGEIAVRIREFYRSTVPHSDRALALVDQYTAEQSVRLRTIGGPLPIEEVGSEIAIKRKITSEGMLSLLLQPDKAVLWLKTNIKLTKPRGRFSGRDYERLMVDILGRPNLGAETKVLLFNLLHENYPVAPIIQGLLQNGAPIDPSVIDRQVRSLYAANAPLGDVVLADLERRRHLPKERIKAAWAAIEMDRVRAKQWRTIAFKAKGSGFDTVLKLMVDRALIAADSGDIAQQVSLVARWIDALSNAPRATWDQLRRYEPAKDATGRRALALLNELSYDSVHDPLGFLMPHERQFWERPLDNSHPSIQLLHRIHDVVRDDDVMASYRYLLDVQSVERATGLLQECLAGKIPTVNPAHVRELMRRAVTDPFSHITFLYWAASKPEIASEAKRWSQDLAGAAALLQEARDAGAEIVGNVMELVMRSDDADGVAEMSGVRYYLTQGNWIHILPRDFLERQPVADMLVMDEHGLQDVVEIKNFRFKYADDLLSLPMRLDWAATQLAYSTQRYPNARPVIFMRVIVDSAFEKPWLVREAMTHYLENNRSQSVAQVVTQIERIGSSSAPNVDVAENPSYSDRVRVASSLNAAGLRLARVLSERLVYLGMVEPVHQQVLVGHLSQANRDAIAIVNETVPSPARILEVLERYGLMSVVNAYLVGNQVQ